MTRLTCHGIIRNLHLYSFDNPFFQPDSDIAVGRVRLNKSENIFSEKKRSVKEYENDTIKENLKAKV